MKKIIIFLLFILISTSICFASDRMPADIKAVTDKITKLTTDYFKAVNRVKSASELAAAINRYADGMEKLGPSIKALEAKYGTASGEENDESDDDTDEMEFQKEWAELMSGSEMNLNYQNFTKYSSDPAVQKAMARLNAVLEKIGISDDEENDEDSNEEDYEE